MTTWEAVERVKRFIEGETCRTIYKLPPNGRMDPLRRDCATLLASLAEKDARIGELERGVVDGSVALTRMHARALAAEARVQVLVSDVLSMTEAIGEAVDMQDGPCPTEGLCDLPFCHAAGCVKDKADRARAALQQDQGHER